MADVPLLLAATLPWLRPTRRHGLTEGMGEIDLAAVLDAYSMPGPCGALVTRRPARSPARPTRATGW